ncbi:MAG TPA: hypothetical protein DEG96_08710 [Candidatus Atribacteria bacterium]|nr:hypothetical protein [Candidatus Atribacteria bacterium]
MRRITFKNAILLILIVSLLSIGLIGCVDIIIPTTGTVKVIIMDDYYSYDVYMDGQYLGTTPKVDIYSNSEKTFYDIPIGLHEFYVRSTDKKYEGWKEQTIYSGYNTVEIYTDYIY